MNNNPARQAIINARNKLFSSILNKIDKIDSKVTELEKLQRQSQQQASVMDTKIAEMINNSGIVQISGHEILVKIFNGLKMYLDTRDIAVAPHIALDGIWEPSITKAWQKLISPTSTVFDIGANFGYFGLLAAQMTDKKRSRVVFVEANPKLIPYIQKTISLNWYNEQSVIGNFAASDKLGSLRLNVLKDYIGSSSVQTVDELKGYVDEKMNLRLEESIKVEAIPIDEFCKKNSITSIDVAKMDIEGYEDIAYAGMRGMVASSPNLTLFIEFTKKAYKKPKEFYQTMLKDFGNVYLIEEDGALTRLKDNSYDSAMGDNDDWVMLVFSKRKDLK